MLSFKLLQAFYFLLPDLKAEAEAVMVCSAWYVVYNIILQKEELFFLA